MHRKLLVLAVLLSVPAAVSAQRVICDPRQSALCTGVSSVYQLEEDSDARRLDAYGFADIREADGVNVGRAAGKIGSYAASFAGTDGTFLFLPYDGALGGGTWTVAMWVYPTSAATTQILLSKDEATIHGSYLALVPYSGQLQVKGIGYYSDTGADVSVTSASSMTLNAWHLVVWGVTPYFFGKQQMFVQIDNGTRDTVALDYWLKGNANDLIIGQRKGASAGSAYTLPYSGRIDQITFSGRYWEPDSSTLFYNAGSGAAFPFTASATAGLNDGLMAYWTFDEDVASGTRYDSINQNNATDPNTNVASATGKISNAADVDYNETLTVTDSSQIRVAGTDFTIGGWINFQNLVGQQFPIGKIDAGLTDAEWVLQHSGTGGTNLLIFQVANGSCSASTAAAPVTQGTWAFVLLEYTYSTKTCKIQVNNGTVYSGTGAADVANESQALRFEVVYSDALYDEWFFYKRLLTTQQKTDLYNSGNGRTYPF